MPKYDFVGNGVQDVGSDVASKQQQLQDAFQGLLKASGPLASAQAWKGVGQEDFAQDLAQLQVEFSNLDNAIQSFLSALSVVRDQAETTLTNCNGIAGNIDAGAV